MTTAYYSIKDQSYFSHVRMDIIDILPDNKDQKILEIGAGGGNTLLYIKENKLAQEVVGIEMMPLQGTEQHHNLIDQFHILDVEQQDIPAENEYFDVIICADVLEHLSDPWTILKKTVKHLKKGGVLLLSAPNIREWKTLFPIIFKGDFRYDPNGGVMDKTHLRFFCRKNLLDLVRVAGLTPIRVTPNFLLKVVAEGRKRRLLNRLTLGLFTDLLTVQYLVVAKKI